MAMNNQGQEKDTKWGLDECKSSESSECKILVVYKPYSEQNSWNAFQIWDITGKQRIKFPIPAIYFI